MMTPTAAASYLKTAHSQQRKGKLHSSTISIALFGYTTNTLIQFALDIHNGFHWGIGPHRRRLAIRGRNKLARPRGKMLVGFL